MASQTIMTLFIFLIFLQITSSANYEVVSTVAESTAAQVLGSTFIGWLSGYLVQSYFDNIFGDFLKWLIYGVVGTGLFLYLFTDFFAEHRMETENSGTYMHWSVRKILLFFIDTTILRLDH
uniref:Uncharacterized protein n=1 Tax=Panagrolaimus superbus TaxID=310955 RepID=A0A914Y0V9_9BILA